MLLWNYLWANGHGMEMWMKSCHQICFIQFSFLFILRFCVCFCFCDSFHLISFCFCSIQWIRNKYDEADCFGMWNDNHRNCNHFSFSFGIYISISRFWSWLWQPVDYDTPFFNKKKKEDVHTYTCSVGTSQIQMAWCALSIYLIF